MKATLALLIPFTLGLFLPIAMNYLILLDPLGLTLFMSGFFMWLFLILLLFKTSALTWLKASLTKSLVVINPRENKYLFFKPVKMHSNLGYVKGMGYYLIDPKDVFIEAQSKVPTAITYSNFAITIDSKMAKVAEKLKALGIKNYEELVRLWESIKNKGGAALNVLGESISFVDILNYFARDERGDIIESEIQRRTAAQVMQKLNAPGNILKWAIILVIIMIGAALAYAIVTQFSPETPDMGMIQRLAEQISQTKVVTQTPPTGTALK